MRVENAKRISELQSAKLGRLVYVPVITFENARKGRVDVTCAAPAESVGKQRAVLPAVFMLNGEGKTLMSCFVTPS